MGTSGSSKGPGSGTPLVPSWLDEPNAAPIPGGDGVVPPASEPGEPDGTEDPNRPAPLPPVPPTPAPQRFRDARTNFTKFATSHGRDERALRRAVGQYVRSGARGSGNATRRMGAARTTASGLLGVLRGIQREGVASTLRRLNLGDLAGRSVVDVFIALTDVICQDGGSIDEGIARDAWLETLSELDELGLANLDGLTAAQIGDIFQSFISHSIEGRLFQDIGVNAVKVPADLSAVEAFEAQFRSYVRRSVRDSFSTDLADLPMLSDEQIRTVVDRTYQEAWDLLLAWGDAAE